MHDSRQVGLQTSLATVVIEPPDEVALRASRLARLRQQMCRDRVDACILFDPVNIRYATGSRNMQVWTLRNPARYAFVPVAGPVVLFEVAGSEHLSRDLETVAEIRPAVHVSYFTCAERYEERARCWTEEIVALAGEACGRNAHLAIDRPFPGAVERLRSHGYRVGQANPTLERARVVKSTEEITCLKAALAVCNEGFRRLRAALIPGVREVELLSILHQTNVALGGEYIETRLLTSGPRTNPWFQESSDRVIKFGELVAVDSDMIGPYGYFADVSRTYLCGEERPTDEQRRLYSLSYEQVAHNLALLRPGVTFREFVEKSWKMPAEFVDNRYMSLVHGAGLCGEYPYITYPEDFEEKGYDGTIVENMTLCVESYIGAKGGTQGVKLEQPVLVTAEGPQVLSELPFENSLL